MGKRQFTLLLADEDVVLAKSKGLNISAEVREFLKIKLYGIDKEQKDKDSLIKELQVKLSTLATELNNERARREKAERKPRDRVIDL